MVSEKKAATSGGKSTTPNPTKKQWGSEKSPPHLRFRDFVITLALTLIMGYGVGFFATKSLTWPIENQYYRKARWMVVSKLKQGTVITEEELARHTGENDGTVWLSIMLEVYDVTSGAKHYGVGGSYSSFSGRDATRAYATGCFDGAHLTHDIRGLDAKQLEKAINWAEFYRYHETYPFIGYLQPDPVDGDVPGVCDYKLNKAVSPEEVIRMRKVKREAKEVMEDVKGRAEDAARDAKDRVQQAANEAKQAAHGYGNQARDAAEGQAREAKNKASGYVHQAGNVAQDYVQKAQKEAEEGARKVAGQ